MDDDVCSYCGLTKAQQQEKGCPLEGEDMMWCHLRPRGDDRLPLSFCIVVIILTSLGLWTFIYMAFKALGLLDNIMEILR